MRLDAQLLFSSAQAITADAASTNIVDLTDARDIGIGGGLMVHAVVATAFATTNSGDMSIRYQGSTDGSTWTTYASSDLFTAAALTVGRDLSFPVPSRQGAMPRYVRLYYEVGTGAFTGGAITAAMVLDAQQHQTYAAGITISN